MKSLVKKPVVRESVRWTYVWCKAASTCRCGCHDTGIVYKPSLAPGPLPVLHATLALCLAQSLFDLHAQQRQQDPLPTVARQRRDRALFNYVAWQRCHANTRHGEIITRRWSKL